MIYESAAEQFAPSVKAMELHSKFQYLVPEPPDEPVACRVPGSPFLDPLQPMSRRSSTQVRNSWADQGGRVV
jgi:hypothetical protein